jgi:hypothetical protein
LRGVATPAPLLLQLIKAVLVIGAVTIELADGLEFVVGVAHQNRVVPAFEWISVLKVPSTIADKPVAVAAPKVLNK